MWAKRFLEELHFRFRIVAYRRSCSSVLLVVVVVVVVVVCVCLVSLFSFSSGYCGGGRGGGGGGGVSWLFVEELPRSPSCKQRPVACMHACLLAWLLAWTRKRTTFSCGRFEPWPRRIRQVGRIQHGDNQWCPPHSNTLRQPRHSHPRIAVFGQRAYAGAVRKSNLVCELIISTLSSLIHDLCLCLCLCLSLSLSISLKVSEWTILQMLFLLNADITNKDCARSWHKSCSDYTLC